jgi:hypothetical protein
MMRNLNPFKKIDSAEIKLEVHSKKIEFSYVFGDKQEKELNLAAGRIHRGSCTNWRLEDKRLIKTLDRQNFTATLGEITELFKEMIK